MTEGEDEAEFRSEFDKEDDEESVGIDDEEFDEESIGLDDELFAEEFMEESIDDESTDDALDLVEFVAVVDAFDEEFIVRSETNSEFDFLSSNITLNFIYLKINHLLKKMIKQNNLEYSWYLTCGNIRA